MTQVWLASLAVLALAACSAASRSGPPNAEAGANPPGSVPANAERWSNPATWGGALPAAGGNVTIPSGKTVLLDASPPPLGSLAVNGALVFDERDLELKAKAIMMHGRLTVGSSEAPFGHRATITLTGAPSSEDVMGMGTKVLGVMGGELDLHGRSAGKSWTRLAATAEAGSDHLVLEEASGWERGDLIAVASTDFEPLQTEEAVVRSVSGREVNLAQPLKHTRWGEAEGVGGGRLEEPPTG